MPRLPLRQFAIVLALLTTTAGCVTVGEEPRPEPVETLPVLRGTAGVSLGGRPIEFLTCGEGDTTVMIIATIHGDEPLGTPLLARLAQLLTLRSDVVEGRTLVLVPIANPDGYARVRRGNSRFVDLNRNFPAKNFQASDDHGPEPLSEPETQALHDLIEAMQPDRIISFHQPLGVIDYDGPGEDLARAIARQSTMPVRKLGARPGSLGSYAGEDLGIPVVTIELPTADRNMAPDIVWNLYSGMLLAAIRYPEELPSANASGPREANDIAEYLRQAQEEERR